MSQERITKKEDDILDSTDSGTAERTEDQIKLYNNSDSEKLQFGVEETRSVTQEITDQISSKDETTAKLEFSMEGYKVSYEQKKSISAQVSDRKSLTVEGSTGCEFGTKKDEFSHGIKVSEHYDISDDIYIEESASNENKVSMDKDGDLKLENQTKAGLKAGSEEYNAEINAEQTSSVSSDGTISHGGKLGGTVHAGPLEGGFSHSGDTSHSDKSESESEKDEVSAGVRLSDQVKIKQTGSLERKESESVDGDVLTKEHEENVGLKTEIEVSEDASAAVKAAAGVTNLFMGVTNAVVSSALSDKSKTEVHMLDAAPQPLLLDSGESEADTEAEEQTYDYDYGIGY